MLSASLSCLAWSAVVAESCCVPWASELEGARAHWQDGEGFRRQKGRKGAWELDAKMCSLYSIAALALWCSARTVAEKHSVQAVPFFFIKRNIFFWWQNTHNIKCIILTTFNLLFSGIRFICMVGVRPHPPPKCITLQNCPLPAADGITVSMVWLFFLQVESYSICLVCDLILIGIMSSTCYIVFQNFFLSRQKDICVSHFF